MTDASRKIRSFLLSDDGTFPNHRDWPLLIYPAALPLTTDDPAGAVEKTFLHNGWNRTWRNGIYPFHHYHSNTHEVLGVFRGAASVQFGGPDGVKLELLAGDVALLPAGTAHRNIGSSNDFGVVGAYPRGPAYDMCYGRPGERPRALRNIAAAAKPETDPVFGWNGGLCERWDQRHGLL